MGAMLLSVTTIACQKKTSETNPGEVVRSARTLSVNNARKAVYDFQKVSIPYDFGLPGEGEQLVSGKLSGPQQQAFYNRLKERRQFIVNQGFVLTAEEAVKRSPMPWREAEQRYRAFVRSNPKPEYAQLFRRNASAYILRDLALLADRSPEGINTIAYHTRELVENGGESYTALMYYCLKALKGEIPEREFEALRQAALGSQGSQQLIAHLKNVVLPDMANYKGMTEAQKKQMREPIEELLNEQMRYEALIRQL